jgi:hypothetical protein
MMFTPNQSDVRKFFCDVYDKHQKAMPLNSMEAVAVDWVTEHPEYFKELSDLPQALAADYSIEAGRSNPFLHLSMHLTIAEQISIDQPRGIKPVFESLRVRLGSAHLAHHHIMECLGRMVWESQRSGLPPDGQAYLDCVRRSAHVKY